MLESNGNTALQPSVLAEDRTKPPIPPCLLAPLRRWRLTLIGLVLSLLVALLVAYCHGQKVWQVEGTIIYTPLATGGLSQGDYVPPSPQTLISLVKSPQRLQRVIEELALPVPLRTLDRALKVNQQATADVVRLSLDWPDPDQGRAILDRLIEAYGQDVVARRRSRIQETLTLLQTERATHSAQLEEARITALIAELNQSSEKLDACQRKIVRTQQKLAANAQPAVDEDGLYAERKRILLEAIQSQEDKIKEIDAETEAKKAEFALTEKAVASGVGSRSDHARASSELELLAVRRRNAWNAASQQKKELADLPQRQIRFALAQLEDERGQLDVRIESLKRRLEANRQDVARLATSNVTEQAASKRLDHAENKFQTTCDRIAAMQRLSDSPIAEFTAAHSAVVLGPPSSNRKVLAILTFGILTSIMLLGLIGYAWLTQPRRPRVRTFGLPIVAVVDTGSAGSGRCAVEARRLALQLRSPVRGLGGLVLFAPTSRAVPTQDVAWQLARYLTLGGEAVLILDARVPDAVPPSHPTDRQAPVRGGIESERLIPGHTARQPDCLRFQVADAMLALRTIGRTGIDYLPITAAFPDADLLASAALQDLLVRLSEEYDRVLLLGPPLDQSLGAEILATHADGAVIVFQQKPGETGEKCSGEKTSEKGGESVECQRAVEAIRAAGVPWVGACVRSSQRIVGQDLPFEGELLRPVDGRNVASSASSAEQLSEEEPGVLSIARS